MFTADTSFCIATITDVWDVENGSKCEGLIYREVVLTWSVQLSTLVRLLATQLSDLRFDVVLFRVLLSPLEK